MNMTRMLLVPIFLLAASAFGANFDATAEARAADVRLESKPIAVVCNQTSIQ